MPMKTFIVSIALALVVGLCPIAYADLVPHTKRWDVKLRSLPPEEVLTKLDLGRPGLETVKAAADNGDQRLALTELLRYYRSKYPPTPPAKPTGQKFTNADRICRHVFQWGPYEPADYGPDIDWAADPADDIEWVAGIYRFLWAEDLRQAYLATRDDKYARAFVELTTDWINKHPLSDWTRTHPVYKGWKGFAWLDLQTGIRATQAATAFKSMVHSEAITPDFLGVFLASLHDHQRKTELIPMGMVHNKAVFEQRGVLNICHAFPEFADTRRWARLAVERVSENFLAQTTADGVQREWCGSYHLAVLKDATDVMQKADDLGVPVSDAYRERLRRMCDYVFAVASPDLAWPMFGDTARKETATDDRRTWALYNQLTGYTTLWNDPKYAARARFDRDKLPAQTSYAFEGAGVYVMRSAWGPQGIYLALHCAPPALSGHDHQDNGTFELYAFGRWLITDSGYYTYGHDSAARTWHRQTQVHQTLTLDRKNTRVDGTLRLWHASPHLDALVVENPSYDNLLHRRSVWFVDKTFFVILDEAIGDASGELRLHWQPAAGPGKLNADQALYTTEFPDANVLIETVLPQERQVEQEDGWFAWDYGKRKPRKTFNVKHASQAPATFVTVIVPYRGTSAPDVKAVLTGDHTTGGEAAELSVQAFGKQWRIGRSLEKQAAWCVPASEQDASVPAMPAVEFDRLATFGSADTEDEFPAIGCDDEGNLWVSWVSYNGTNDVVLAARVDDEKGVPVRLSASAGDHWRPAMGKDGQGRLWATWAQNEGGNWDIWAKFLAGGQWSEAIRLTQGDGNDFCQKLAADSTGRLWMTWQSVIDNNYEILLAPITPAGAGRPINVSRHPASDWEPAIATASDGRVFVAWDTYRTGSYDVLVAEMKNGQLAEPVAVAATPAYEAHAALAVDHADRLWIAWDNGGTEWGTNNLDNRRLHSQRSVEIGCRENGTLCEPTEPLAAALTGPLNRFCELPELIVDAEGRLWLFVRHLTDLTPEPEPPRRRSQTRGIWNPYALCYIAGIWSQPRVLPKSNGRNDMRVAACLNARGQVATVWADDERKETRSEEPGNHNVHAMTIRTPPASPHRLSVKPLAEKPATAANPPPSPAKPDRHILTANGKNYMLLYGDTHRHTDISRCGMNIDGSLMDTYRYAIDVAQLDFLAISDHDQDIHKHRYERARSLIQHYAWWRSEKYCDLFYIESTFVPLYAYEHGGSFQGRGGHKNVLYAERGNPCYEEDAPEDLFRLLEGKEAVAIPHQLADGGSATDWTRWNPRFERVAEIFQARGSYEYLGARPTVEVSREGHYYWDALAMGIRIGVIASSDHGSVCSAYAGVYCSDLSRKSVLEGLRSRRTFGAMDPIVIDFRLQNDVLGQEAEIESPPEFHMRVETAEPLTKVQIVKNGQFVHTVNPGSATCQFEYVDRKIKPGQQAWYYVRCEYGQERYGWSSPIWVGWKPQTDTPYPLPSGPRP